MENIRSRLTLAAIAMTVSLLTSPYPVKADISVLASTAPALKKGMELDDDASITVPPGKSVRLLLPDGRTRTIKGPFSGQVWDPETEQSVAPSFSRQIRSTASGVAKGGATQSGTGTIQDPAPTSKVDRRPASTGGLNKGSQRKF